jgi:signal transduction histidine kinase
MAYLIDYQERDLERLKFAQDFQRSEFIEQAGIREQDEAAALGRMLLHDPDGPFWARRLDAFVQRGEATPEPASRDETNEPAWMVSRLISTEAGCQWLLDRWAELRGEFETRWEPCWRYEEDFKAARLMGQDAVQALTDPELAEVFVASYAVDRRRRSPFIELRHKVSAAEMKKAAALLSAEMKASVDRRDPTEGRQRLLAIIDRETARLRSRIEQYREPARIEMARKALEEAFDASDTNKQLERDMLKSARLLARWRRNLDERAARTARTAGVGDRGQERHKSGRVKRDDTELRT